MNNVEYRKAVEGMLQQRAMELTEWERMVKHARYSRPYGSTDEWTQSKERENLDRIESAIIEKFEKEMARISGEYITVRGSAVDEVLENSEYRRGGW